LIGAGAGLSADDGVGYTDEADFAAKYPALVARGLRAAYQTIGYSDLPVEAFWGYRLTHVEHVRFGDGRRRVYELRRELVVGGYCSSSRRTSMRCLPGTASPLNASVQFKATSPSCGA